MADRPKTTDELIADLEHRLQTVSTFAANLAAQLCRQGTFTRETADKILEATNPPIGANWEASDPRRIAAQAATHEVGRLAVAFEEYLYGR
jgi:hypothetical protein